ncbi:MAG TPA: EamA family transporter [Gemmatimonadales bacterium]|nr:EamA family transporter [Gemmatimonadales bacterium]
MNQRWKIVAAFFAVYVFWGMTYLAMRVAVEDIPPYLMAGTRFVLAGLILYAVARHRGDDAPTALNWRAAVVVGGFLLLGGNASVAWAEQRVSSGLAALLIGVMPIWMVSLEWLRGGSRPRLNVVAGLLLGALGVGLLVLPRGGGDSVDLLGAIVLIVAAASWAWGSVISKSAGLPKSPFMATSMEMIAGGTLCVLVAVLTGELGNFSPAHVSGEALLAWLFLVIFGSLVAFTAFIWLLGVVSIAKVGTYAYVNPIVAVVLGWAILGEQITLTTVFAAILILCGVAMVNLDWGTAATRAQPPVPLTSPSDLQRRL